MANMCLSVSRDPFARILAISSWSARLAADSRRLARGGRAMTTSDAKCPKHNVHGADIETTQ